MNGDHLFASPGREHLSPRSRPSKRHNPRTDPFYSPPGIHSPETSPYTSELHSPDDMMETPKNNIQFESVDWEKRNQPEKKVGKQRTITPTRRLTREPEYTETINLTPPMTHQAPSQHTSPSAVVHQIPKPIYYSPPTVQMPTPPPYQGASSGGLGIQYFEEKQTIVSPHSRTLSFPLTLPRPTPTPKKLLGNQPNPRHPTTSPPTASSPKWSSIGRPAARAA